MKSLLVALLGLLIATGSAPGQVPRFEVDNSHTSLIFGVSHLGLSYTYGRFNRIGGAFQYDPADPAAAQFRVDIDVSSIDTNDAKRDEHLRGPDFFDASQFPRITFVSKSATPREKGINLVGEITLHGVTREITIPLEFMGESNTPQMGHRMGFTTQFPLKRSDFGMDYGLQAVGDEIMVMFSFEGIQQGP